MQLILAVNCSFPFDVAVIRGARTKYLKTHLSKNKDNQMNVLTLETKTNCQYF